MSRKEKPRPPYLGSNFPSQLDDAVQKTMALNLFDIKEFDITELVDRTFGKLCDNFAKVKDSLPPDICSRISYNTTPQAYLVYPLVENVMGNSPHWGHGSDSFMTYKEYRTTILNPPEYRDKDRLGIGMSLQLLNKRLLPIRPNWAVGEWGCVDGADDGFILTPRRIGEDMYDALQRPMQRLFAMAIGLTYMRNFGSIAARYITTEGICKRIWPEAANFIGPDKAEMINRAKPSTWPKKFRSKMQDLYKPCYDNDWDENNPNTVDTNYLHRQLAAISDMLCNARLMPELDEYNSNDISITSIYPVRIEPDQFNVAP